MRPEDWRVEGADVDNPDEPEEPGEPQELNSNGTVKWGAWVDPQGDNSKLYNTGDGVTDGSGQRWTSAHDKNGNPPADGWWTKA